MPRRLGIVSLGAFALRVFFVVFLHRRGGRAVDVPFEDRGVLPRRGRQAGGGVDDRVEDQFDQEAAAARGAGGGPGVVDDFVVFGFQDAAFFEEFDFPAEAGIGVLGGGRAGFGRWSGSR